MFLDTRIEDPSPFAVFLTTYAAALERTQPEGLVIAMLVVNPLVSVTRYNFSGSNVDPFVLYILVGVANTPPIVTLPPHNSSAQTSTITLSIFAIEEILIELAPPSNPWI